MFAALISVTRPFRRGRLLGGVSLSLEPEYSKLMLLLLLLLLSFPLSLLMDIHLLLLLLLLSLTMLDCFDKPLIADKLCSTFTGCCCCCCFGVVRSVIVDEVESVITPFSDIVYFYFIFILFIYFTYIT